MSSFVQSSGRLELDQNPSTCGKFVSAKTLKPIHFRRRWHLDALRTITLDPKVTTISPYDGDDPLPDDAETPIHIELRSGAIIAAFSKQTNAELFCGTLPLRIFQRHNVEVEPNFSNTKAIWSASDTIVDAADRLRILIALDLQSEGMPISKILGLVRHQKTEPAHAVLRMVLDNDLTLDISKPIRPDTVIRAANSDSHPSKRILFLSQNKISETNAETDCRTHQVKPEIPRKKSPNRDQIEMLIAISFQFENAAPSTGNPIFHHESSDEERAQLPEKQPQKMSLRTAASP